MEFKVGQTVINTEGCGEVDKNKKYVVKKDYKTGCLYIGNYNFTTKIGSYCSCSYDWKLVGKGVSMKDCKWGVKYERDEDPVEFFKSRKDAEKRATELLDDSDVDKSEIYVFEVGETFKVDRPVSFKLVKV